MSYLEVNLDPFIQLKSLVEFPLTNPVNLLSYIESVGAAGISFTYRPENPAFNEISTLKALTNARINIRVSTDNQAVQRAVLLKPDMITLTDPETPANTLKLPSKVVKEVVDSVGGDEDLGLALRLPMDVKQLKEAYQFGCDEVELATDPLAEQTTHKEFLNHLEILTHVFRIGVKNNLRISLAGRLDRRLIQAISEVITPEFYSVDKSLLAQGLIKGFEPALQELIDLVEYI